MADEITIRIPAGDGFVHVSKLAQDLHALLRSLSSIDQHLSDGRGRTVEWGVVRASFNSPLTLTIAPRAAGGEPPRMDVAARYLGGLRAIQEGRREPEDFTPEAMSATVQMISRLPAGATLSNGAMDAPPIELGESLKAGLEAAIRSSSYRIWSSIEGTLYAIDTSRKTRQQFRVFDRLTGHPTDCIFKREDLPRVVAAHERRVIVRGMTNYDKYDRPYRVEVEDFEVIPPDSELPSFDGDHRIDITGGVPSEDYVRRLRDGD